MLAAAMQAWDQVDQVEATLAGRLASAGYRRLCPRWVRMLQCVADRPGDTISRLGRACGTTNGAYELRRLEELGLVDVVSDDRDARVKSARLTQAGVALLAAIDREETAC